MFFACPPAPFLFLLCPVDFSPFQESRRQNQQPSDSKGRGYQLRTAVEKLLEMEEKQRFEQELASAYAANANLSLGLAEEFAVVDREGI